MQVNRSTPKIQRKTKQMDFDRLEWGGVAKDTTVEKQQKYAVMAQNRPLRSFRKGRGASAKQRWGRNATWGAIAKAAPKTQRVG